MADLKLEHHTLHYVMVGDRTHPPLLLLHGFLGSHQDFTAILPRLSEQFCCIMPDLPGHGKTLTQAGYYTFEATAQALLHLLDHLSIPQAHLLGYSMGGRLALYLTCCFPKWFMRVVLESASPGLKTAEERAERVVKDSAIAHQLDTTSLPDFLTQWYHNPLFISLKRHPEAFVAMLHRRQNNNSTELAQALRGMSTGRQPSLWNFLPAVNHPLLLLAGADDSKFMMLTHDMLVSAQQNEATQAMLKSIEDCGHNIHVEAPDLYLETIIPFFNE